MSIPGTIPGKYLQYGSATDRAYGPARPKPGNVSSFFLHGPGFPGTHCNALPCNAMCQRALSERNRARSLGPPWNEGVSNGSKSEGLSFKKLRIFSRVGVGIPRSSLPYNAHCPVLGIILPLCSSEPSRQTVLQSRIRVTTVSRCECTTYRPI